MLLKILGFPFGVYGPFWVKPKKNKISTGAWILFEEDAFPQEGDENNLPTFLLLQRLNFPNQSFVALKSPIFSSLVI